MLLDRLDIHPILLTQPYQTGLFGAMDDLGTLFRAKQSMGGIGILTIRPQLDVETTVVIDDAKQAFAQAIAQSQQGQAATRGSRAVAS